MKISLIVLLITIFSCNNVNQNTAKTDSVVLKDDTTEKGIDTTNDKVSDTINTIETNDSVINIKFAKDSISTTVSGKMKGINHPVTVYIPIKQGKQLKAILTTKEPVANIRFNQIFTPDGKADGPFGKELKRAIHEQGTYKLIISEDMMQGEEFKGSFKLTVVVK